MVQRHVLCTTRSHLEGIDLDERHLRTSAADLEPTFRTRTVASSPSLLTRFDRTYALHQLEQRRSA
jgi:hypothetical protein